MCRQYLVQLYEDKLHFLIEERMEVIYRYISKWFRVVFLKQKISLVISLLPPGTLSLLGILCARPSLGTSRYALESVSQRG